MPPVRVISETEAKRVLTSMGYQLANEWNGVLTFIRPGEPDTPVSLDFGEGPILEFLLFPSLEKQGVDTNEFSARLRGMDRPQR